MGVPSPAPKPAKARVAIIVTCFNDGETLGETVASLRMGAADAELVIIDDGSSDPQTLKLLAELERQGILTIRQSNQGQAKAAMVGLEATSAPYIMRFDA